jgi:Uncharacterised protein family (UPF0236)
MGNISITQEWDREKEIKPDSFDWEERFFRHACQLAREEAQEYFQELDKQLFLQRPASFESRGFEERTFITSFGELRIKRRLYRDEKGVYHYLLDEKLGWPRHQIATPKLQAKVVKLASRLPFRQVYETVEDFTAAVLSASTIHRLVQKTGQKAIEKEKIDCQAVYARGETLPGQERQVPILFSERDGAWVHTQREKQKHYEVKQAICYEGWEKLPVKGERYQLVGKRVYCQGSEEIPFGEGASLEWAKVWDLSYLKEIVIGGDGARWIDSGTSEIPGAIRQLDGFHLARACGRGWQEGKAIYEAIRGGEGERARFLMHQLKPREGRGVHKARQYVERNVDKGRDWRTGSEREGRGLGTMEANEDKLICNRMKKRGLSWTIPGALRMNKVIQLAANKEIQQFCLRERSVEKGKTITSPKNAKSQSKDYQKWIEASVPALAGPHASRPWADKLRNLVYPSFPLN